MAVASSNARVTVGISPRPRGRAVGYAEELGLTELWTDAKAAEDSLGILYHQRAQAEHSIRSTKKNIAQHETQILCDLRNANPEQGPTAFERDLKYKLGGDESLRNMEHDLYVAQGKLGEIEAEIKSEEAVLKNRQSRMRHLGGFFEYLAASKESQTADKLFGQIP